MARWLLLAGLLSAVLTVFVATRGDDARAAGPCGTSHDAVDAEEQQFLGLLQTWRAGFSNEPVQLSGALNSAAAWFAEWQVTNGAYGTHNDQFGRTWKQRAIDCGYTATTSKGEPWAQASGEGIFGAPTGGTNVAPSQALAGMIAHAGSGIYMTNFPNFPAKCYGVAVYRNGTKVAWVVVIAALPAAMPCPGGSGGGAPGPSATATTPPSGPTSPAPTKTPTATPTPSVFYSWFSSVAKD